MPAIHTKEERERAEKTIKMLLANNMKAEALEMEIKFGFVKKGETSGTDDPMDMSIVATEEWLAKLITKDARMLTLKDDVRKLAAVNDSVLVIGESGTGKELVARSLHGGRKGKFIALNCAGMPEHLIESELFGHEVGAFTGAIKAKAGLFKEAADGTVFLDEIGELPLPLQAKLLRVLQEKVIRKVGGNIDEKINCRFVAATHQNLDECVAKNKFRLDLYYRLATFVLRTEPIGARLDDVPDIVKALVGTTTKPTDYSLSEEVYTVEFWKKQAEAKLLVGNVRSVQSIIRRLQVLGR